MAGPLASIASWYGERSKYDHLRPNPVAFYHGNHVFALFVSATAHLPLRYSLESSHIAPLLTLELGDLVGFGSGRIAFPLCLVHISHIFSSPLSFPTRLRTCAGAKAGLYSCRGACRVKCCRAVAATQRPTSILDEVAQRGWWCGGVYIGAYRRSMAARRTGMYRGGRCCCGEGEKQSFNLGTSFDRRLLGD